MKVLIAGGGTGGHLMPALAIADALVAVRSDLEPVLVGSRRGLESTILPTRPYSYHLLPSEPIYRRQWWRNWKWPWLAWHVLRESSRVLERERPVFAVSTGGYAAGPITYQAHRAGVPYALVELNAYPGVTTRWLARSATQIFLAFPEAQGHLRVGASTAVHAFGNPIVPPPDPRPNTQAARRSLGIPAETDVVLVTGGSQGALSINRAVAELVSDRRMQGRALLWSTGRLSYDRYAEFNRPPLRQVRAFWDPIADAYAAADLVVARAGGSTAELCAWGLPAILIPLPSAAAAHQQKNAEALAAAGAALHLPEGDLSGAVLADAIDELLTDRARLRQMGVSARSRGQPDAAKRTASALLRMVS